VGGQEGQEGQEGQGQEGQGGQGGVGGEGWEGCGGGDAAALCAADVILVSGGNTLFAVDAWTSYGLVPHLR
jgi:hypothetical protein